jgi:CRISPR-associated endonuclease Cas1
VELASSAKEIERQPPQSMDTLRGVEGRVAQSYFAAWRATPLRWKALSRKPIPEEWKRIGPRVAPNRKSNRSATHPINALCNYGLAVLESHVQMAVVAAGLDPTVGFMHADGERRSALVLDLMEPMRPVVDGVVLELARSQAFSPTDFVLRDDGVCRLSPELARTASSHAATAVAEQHTVSKNAAALTRTLASLTRTRAFALPLGGETACVTVDIVQLAQMT